MRNSTWLENIHPWLVFLYHRSQRVLCRSTRRPYPIGPDLGEIDKPIMYFTRKIETYIVIFFFVNCISCLGGRISRSEVWIGGA